MLASAPLTDDVDTDTDVDGDGDGDGDDDVYWLNNSMNLIFTVKNYNTFKLIIILWKIHQMKLLVVWR